jgi:hypoxanthine phosphoribosyltransferase
VSFVFFLYSVNRARSRCLLCLGRFAPSRPGFIIDRVQRLAQQIVASDPGPLIVICVLKGGYLFFSELANAIKQHSSREGHEVPIRMEFIKCESYHGTESGDLKITTLTDLQDFRGRNLLLVEDIVDTGKTLVKLIEKLNVECQPKSVKVATMVLKKTERSNGFVPEYVGFAVPDLFIIGFGLDYNEHGREVRLSE